MPKSNIEIREAIKEFYNVAKFPCFIGPIDCTHIKIQSLGKFYTLQVHKSSCNIIKEQQKLGGNTGEIYRNGYFSMNVQAICQANLSISNVVARWPGSAHDSTIFSNSRAHAEFERGIYSNNYLLGKVIKKYYFFININMTNWVS